MMSTMIRAGIWSVLFVTALWWATGGNYFLMLAGWGLGMLNAWAFEAWRQRRRARRIVEMHRTLMNDERFAKIKELRAELDAIEAELRKAAQQKEIEP